MTNLRERLIIPVLLTVIGLSGCGGSSSSSSNTDEENISINVSLNGAAYVENESSQVQSFSANIAAASSTVQTTIQDDLLKEKLQSANRGNLVNRYTPSRFIVDIDLLGLTNGSVAPYLHSDGTASSPSTQGPFTEIITAMSEMLIDLDQTAYYGGNVPKHYDVAHADRIIRNAAVKESSYSSFILWILPFGYEIDNDITYEISVVIVDLGEKYKDVTFAKTASDDLVEMFELTAENSDIASLISKKATEHIFVLQGLQPMPHGFFSNLVVSSEVDRPYVINGRPDGNGQYLGLGGIIVPGEKLDFSGFENPTVNLSWKMENLIEVYDNKTPNDITDDLVTLNLDNPFPISMKVVEQPARGESLYTSISNPMISHADTLDILKDRVKTVIVDDDGLNSQGTVRFASNAYNVNEADDKVQIQVIREAGKSGGISVNYRLTDINQSARIGEDYRFEEGTLTWTDNDMNPKYIEIPIIDDAASEPMEYFDLEIVSRDSTDISGWAKTRVNIYDDSEPDRVSGILFASDYFYGVESNDTLEVKLVRVGNPETAISINVDTISALATKSVDFTSQAETFIWDTQNMASKTYTIDVIDDDTAEPFPNDPNDSTPPDEVLMLAARQAGYETILLWVNPVNEDFDHVLITRKAGSAPIDENDGEAVYRSYIPHYIDMTGQVGVKYFYLVQTVDKSGNISSGRVVHRVQTNTSQQP